MSGSFFYKSDWTNKNVNSRWTYLNGSMRERERERERGRAMRRKIESRQWKRRNNQKAYLKSPSKKSNRRTGGSIRELLWSPSNSRRSGASTAIVRPDHLFSAVNFFSRLHSILLNKCPFRSLKSFTVNSLITSNVNQN